MSWLGLVLVVLGAYLAWKLVGALLKIAMFVLVLVGAYWFAAPHLGWPTVSELFYVLCPDFGGRRLEEVLQPRAIADGVTDRVVDGVVERLAGPPSPAPDAAVEVPAEALPAADVAADQVQPLREE